MSAKEKIIVNSVALLLIGTPLAAWVTHVLRCINTEAWLFLIAGAIAAPIGVIHGIGIWFGAF